MNISPPGPAGSPRSHDHTQLRAWLRLRHDLAEMHAELEYLRLMMSLRMGRHASAAGRNA